MKNEIISAIKCQHHSALRVSDWNVSKKFYESLGFRTILEWIPLEDGLRMAMIELPGGGRIEMFEGGKGKLAENHEIVSGSYFQYCFDVPVLENVDKLYEYALSIGAKIKLRPANYEMHGTADVHCRAAFVYAPDGEIIEFLSLHFD